MNEQEAPANKRKEASGHLETIAQTTETRSFIIGREAKRYDINGNDFYSPAYVSQILTEIDPESFTPELLKAAIGPRKRKKGIFGKDLQYIISDYLGGIMDLTDGENQAHLEQQYEKPFTEIWETLWKAEFVHYIDHHQALPFLRKRDLWKIKETLAKTLKTIPQNPSQSETTSTTDFPEYIPPSTNPDDISQDLFRKYNVHGTVFRRMISSGMINTDKESLNKLTRVLQEYEFLNLIALSELCRCLDYPDFARTKLSSAAKAGLVTDLTKILPPKEFVYPIWISKKQNRLHFLDFLGVNPNEYNAYRRKSL